MKEMSVIIPRIIHQIWSDKHHPFPKEFELLSNTWKEMHPDWQYIRWNDVMMDDFVKKEYPEFYDMYQSFPFNMQRWDSFRFLLLYRLGGVHVDCDYECLENIEPLLSDHSCCIALEPETHCVAYGVTHFLNSALLGCVPKHVFLKRVIDKIFSPETLSFDSANKPHCILHTTGPLMLSGLYASLSIEDQHEIHLLPAKHVTPFDSFQIRQVKNGIENDELEACLEEAYAVHYFTNLWVANH